METPNIEIPVTGVEFEIDRGSGCGWVKVVVKKKDKVIGTIGFYTNEPSFHRLVETFCELENE